MAASSSVQGYSGGERLLSQFRTREGHPRLLQLTELQRWWESEHEGLREVDRERTTNVKDLLQPLVDSGALGCRVISTEGSEFTLYWCKHPGGQLPGQTPSQRQKQATPMSASLRGRLKRSRHQFVSPLISSTSAKKQRLNSSQPASIQTDKPVATRLDFTDCETSQGGGKGEGRERVGGVGRRKKGMNNEGVEEREKGVSEGGDCDQLLELREERKKVRKELEEAEERLRKLRMVKMYRSKNDLDQLESLTHKWREVSQEAAEELVQSSTHHPPPTTAQLLDHLHIDHSLIQYSAEDEAFY